MATPAFKVGVWETATVTGTGTVTLSGTAKTGPYQNFSGITSGSLVTYRIQDNTTYAWEVGWGIYTVTTAPAGTLTRNVIESSNSGSLVSFAGNSCDVTLEIVSPVISGGGSASLAGRIAALNGSGLLDGSFSATRFVSFSSSGSFVVPFTGTYYFAGCAGGAGGTDYNSGGAGQFVLSFPLALTAGDVLAITLGAGGAGAPLNVSSGAGGNTTVVDTTTGATLLTLNGAPGVSGSASVVGPGYPGGGSSQPGAGGPFGAGGQSPPINANGGNAYGYGAGGGSGNGASSTGGNGAPGYVEIWW